MKKLIASGLSTATLLVATTPVFAQRIDPCPVGQFSNLCNLAFSGSIVGRLITIAFIVAVLLALAFLIFGGIRWILSGGDKANVEAARNTIVASLVGLVIVFLSYFILTFVLRFFGIDLNNLVIPQL